MDGRILNIIDEAGNAIGQSTRDEIHKKGLLHAEIHVWFYTSRGEIILQHRAKDKDTYPDLLDATVGGHVEIGDTYEQTALKEAEEETGVRIDPKDLVFLCTTITKSFDTVTSKTNHPRRNVYAYHYSGDVADLKEEREAGIGFESWSINTLLNLSVSDAQRFIPGILNIEIMKKIKSLV
ncbi:MAG: NUDIX domain-containing protein [Candidatus Uhrbacteria bacterium]|nr:NUDIX domain-containing protein [Candidatus Uhrbacteria bacterium]